MESEVVVAVALALVEFVVVAVVLVVVVAVVVFSRKTKLKGKRHPFLPDPQALREGRGAGVVAGLAPNGAVPAPSRVPEGWVEECERIELL